MAYSTPDVSMVAGDVFTAADIIATNNNMKWVTTDYPRARVYHNADQTLADNVAGGEILAFNSESYDVGSMHSASTSGSQLVVPTGGSGYYLVGAAISIAANATGGRGLLIKKNAGLTVIASQFCQAVATASVNTELTTSTAVQAVAGDYFTCWGYQARGGAATLAVKYLTDYSPTFWAHWIGR